MAVIVCKYTDYFSLSKLIILCFLIKLLTRLTSSINIALFRDPGNNSLASICNWWTYLAHDKTCEASTSITILDGLNIGMLPTVGIAFCDLCFVSSFILYRSDYQLVQLLQPLVFHLPYLQIFRIELFYNRENKPAYLFRN